MSNRLGAPGHARVVGTVARGQSAYAAAAKRANVSVPAPRRESAGSDEWMVRGACTAADPNLFHGPDGERSGDKADREDVARAVCMRCPVLELCRVWALQNPAVSNFGMWAGVTEDLRREARLGPRKKAGRPTAAAKAAKSAAVPVAVGASA